MWTSAMDNTQYVYLKHWYLPTSPRNNEIQNTNINILEMVGGCSSLVSLLHTKTTVTTQCMAWSKVLFYKL
jgi:hypothetical protein